MNTMPITLGDLDRMESRILDRVEERAESDRRYFDGQVESRHEENRNGRVAMQVTLNDILDEQKKTNGRVSRLESLIKGVTYAEVARWVVIASGTFTVLKYLGFLK